MLNKYNNQLFNHSKITPLKGGNIYQKRGFFYTPLILNRTNN